MFNVHGKDLRQLKKSIFSSCAGARRKADIFPNLLQKNAFQLFHHEGPSFIHMNSSRKKDFNASFITQFVSMDRIH